MIGSAVGDASSVGVAVGDAISIVEVGIAGDVAVGKEMDVDSTIGAFVVVQEARKMIMIAMIFFMTTIICLCEGGDRRPEAISSESVNVYL